MTHYYIWEDGKPLKEYVSGTTDVYTAGTTMYFYYDMNGRPYALQYNGTTYYYLLNAQGDVIRLVNSAGTTVASYEYDPFGNILSATGTMAEANPLRYRGYYYDRETGFYYVSSRYYDPEIGRWINADIPETLTADFENFAQYNLFAYCFNNPVNLSDETGTWPSWATKLAIGVGAIVIGAAVDGFANGFMTGGIMAGGSQILSSGFKVAANAGVPTGRNGGLTIGNKVRVLSPNHPQAYEAGGTLLKIGSKYKNIRFDVGSNSLFHMNIQLAKTANYHIPIGMLGAGLWGGIARD